MAVAADAATDAAAEDAAAVLVDAAAGEDKRVMISTITSMVVSTAADDVGDGGVLSLEMRCGPHVAHT